MFFFSPSLAFPEGPRASISRFVACIDGPFAKILWITSAYQKPRIPGWLCTWTLPSWSIDTSSGRCWGPLGRRGQCIGVTSTMIGRISGSKIRWCRVYKLLDWWFGGRYQLPSQQFSSQVSLEVFSSLADIRLEEKTAMQWLGSSLQDNCGGVWVIDNQICLMFSILSDYITCWLGQKVTEN